MKLNTLMRVVLSLGLAGATLVGRGQAQDPIYPSAREDVQSHEMKREAKREKSLAKIGRWAERQNAKNNKRLVKEGRFDTPSTARGSEVRFIGLDGQYAAVGYIDKNNNFRSYTKIPER